MIMIYNHNNGEYHPIEVKENILLCGRNISGTHIAHSNFRAMPICVGTGEAAGVAAALSVKRGLKLSQVNVKEIQNYLGE